MDKICVYTCITGDYDDLHEIEHPEKDVDYYCFTNNKELESKTWKIIQIKNRGLDDQRLSRKIKMLGHSTISKKYDISVWVDASIIWQSSIKKFVAQYLKTANFAAFRHHQRNSIREESIECLINRKDSKDAIMQTLNYLDSQKFADDCGLYEMTVFIKRHNDPIVIKTMRLWFDMVTKFSKRDQLSFMFAIWKTGLKVDPIDLNVWDNIWFSFEKHNFKTIVNRCDVYYGDLNNSFDFDKYYSYCFEQKGICYRLKTVIPYDTDVLSIIVSDVPGVLYDKVVVFPKTKKIEPIRSISCRGKNVFFSTNSVIVAYGAFYKGQSLDFSIEMRMMSRNDLIDFSKNLWQDNIDLSSENALLTNKKVELDNIKSSRSWKLLQFMHRMIPKKS